ncbi:SDR family NAD(P)-dependent oxidoreductase [Mucilaginibacter terrae]|uniref:3-oxoacyl-[acyl-carrier protein] reductase n=1 Tax=Mucilaginibacter terrae TaxID=1955052 RepID=A0ABU3GR55_9SPHI|nr:SDR family oxidoreductase [Mucilaginibacter terrae]MDT3401437.1 3-oxoacyl-[acyl-carrier protein] reductase [Mucilaginibacter terrae]
MNFKGKNYLIAGAASAIGTILLKSLSAKGANIYAMSRQDSTEWPDDIHYMPADVSKPVDGLAAFLPQQLHGLVYCAGSINLKPFARLTDDDFMNDYLINTLGAIRVIRQALPKLKASGNASVVLISSVAAQTGMAYHTSISTAKGALEGFALALAAEVANQQIRVNVVAPSLTDTPLASALLSSDEKKEASNKRHPLGRYGQPGDISNAIEFLLSENSGWVTGQVLPVDGGMGKLKMF